MLQQLEETGLHCETLAKELAAAEQQNSEKVFFFLNIYTHKMMAWVNGPHSYQQLCHHFNMSVSMQKVQLSQLTQKEARWLQEEARLRSTISSLEVEKEQQSKEVEYTFGSL